MAEHRLISMAEHLHNQVFEAQCFYIDTGMEQ